MRGSVTIVMVTHNMQQAARVSDRTAFMLDGTLVELANTRSLFTMPTDPRTEAYLTGRFWMTSTPRAGFVELKDFSAWFAQNQALRAVSVTFAPGTVTALIGPSGCGKTTLLRATNRLNDLITEFRSEGLILLDGENIYARGVDTSLLRQRVGMVFQRSNPFSSFGV